MTYSIDWNLAGLRENPFIIGPPTNPKQAIWAGLKELKGEFKSVFWEAKASAPTQVILCRGSIGGGKTHASLFFSSDRNIPETSPSVQNIEVLRVQTLLKPESCKGFLFGYHGTDWTRTDRRGGQRNSRICRTGGLSKTFVKRW